MRIVNKEKFLRMITLMVGIVLLITVFSTNKSYSKGEIKEKVIYVSKGDTLWNIASTEKENNIYYQDKDIRDIISDIKKMNNLNSKSYLSIGQKLIIKSL